MIIRTAIITITSPSLWICTSPYQRLWNYTLNKMMDDGVKVVCQSKEYNGSYNKYFMTDESGKKYTVNCSTDFRTSTGSLIVIGVNELCRPSRATIVRFEEYLINNIEYESK